MAFRTCLLRWMDRGHCAGQKGNPERRSGTHRAGTPGGHTATRLPIMPAWSREFATREEALTAERQIKGWNPAKKEALIHGDWKDAQRQCRGNEKPVAGRLRWTAPFDTPGQPGFMEASHGQFRHPP